MVEYETELPVGSTLILTAPTTNTENELYKAALRAVQNPKIGQIIWICYHKVPNDVMEYLTECNVPQETIDKIQFIDMMSNMLGLEQKSDKTYYCSTPTDYNCLLRNVEQLTNNDQKNLIIFDNINALLSYDMVERMIRFIRNLNSLISNNKCPIIYLGIAGATSHEIEISIEAAMDNTYNLQGTTVKTHQIDRMNQSWGQLKKVSWTDVFSLNSPLIFLLIIVMLLTNIFLLVALFAVVFVFKT